MIFIYFLIIVLFTVLVMWTWNNVKDFENNTEKIKFIIIGLIILFICTIIIFAISKTGIKYPNDEVLKQVRCIAIFLCVPINGYISLPHIAKIKSEIYTNSIEEEKSKKRIIILVSIITIITILEIFYLKDFQRGIINNLVNKNQ